MGDWGSDVCWFKSLASQKNHIWKVESETKSFTFKFFGAVHFYGGNFNCFTKGYRQ